MINVGLVPASHNCPTSWYRCHGPWGELRKAHRDISPIMLKEWYWSTCSMLDAVFMQRPFTDSYLTIARMIVANGLPLWVDFDDDIFCVPKFNPNYATYARDDVRRNVAEIVAMADVVTVSTPALARAWARLNPNIIVIPNAINERLLGPAVTPEPELRDLVLWRGSKTHKGDLEIAAEACYRLSHEFPEITFAFVGSDPWFANMMPNERTFIIESLDVIEYHEFIRKCAPAVQIVPLLDCPFNHSKSNCAWLEGSWAGAAVLAPAWDEWQQPGVTTYREPKEFMPALRRMLETRHTTGVAQAALSWDHISKHLTLSETNRMRATVLEGLLDGTYRNARNATRGDAGRLLPGDDAPEQR